MQRLEDVDKSLFHYINKASVDLNNYFNRLLNQNISNINTQEWILLSHVIEHPGKNQKWFGENILKDKTTTMRMIDSLEKKGLIKRIADGSDRRQNLLYATRDGEKLINKTIPFIKEAFKSIFSGIENEQLIMMTSLLEEVINKIYILTK
jgi:DNA-binding MarR family transcriptional regulator